MGIMTEILTNSQLGAGVSNKPRNPLLSKLSPHFNVFEDSFPKLVSVSWWLQTFSLSFQFVFSKRAKIPN